MKRPCDFVHASSEARHLLRRLSRMGAVAASVDTYSANPAEVA